MRRPVRQGHSRRPPLSICVAAYLLAMTSCSTGSSQSTTTSTVDCLTTMPVPRLDSVPHWLRFVDLDAARADPALAPYLDLPVVRPMGSIGEQVLAGYVALRKRLPILPATIADGLSENLATPIGTAGVRCSLSNEDGREMVAMAPTAARLTSVVPFVVRAVGAYMEIDRGAVTSHDTAPLSGESLALMSTYQRMGALAGRILVSTQQTQGRGFGLVVQGGSSSAVILWSRHDLSDAVLRRVANRAVASSSFPTSAVDLSRARVAVHRGLVTITVPIVDPYLAASYQQTNDNDPIFWSTALPAGG